mgnify:FL=1
MGATNCPETPRQRMISMMYLVYTAMLALNVSAEILQAFVTVGDSMEVTNKLLLGKAESTYIMFENSYKQDPGKVGENWAKAQEVRAKTKEIINYIDNIKYELFVAVEGTPGGVKEAKKLLDAKGFDAVVKKDEYSTPTNYFLEGSEDGSKGKAIELRKKIETYQKDMLTYASGSFKNALKNMQIKTEGSFKNAAGQTLNWQMYNFFHTITLADMVLLNKFKSEIQNAELDLVNHLYSAVSADDFKFNTVIAKVIPKSTYIIQGGQYEAEVFVAAYDSRSELTGEVRGQQYVGDSGMLKLKFGAGAIGPQKYNGTLYVKKESGAVPYDFQGEYFVAAPSATISPTKMNVLYIGVENPISVSVPGANSKDVNVSATGAGISLRKIKDGEYVATVKSQGKASINVTANMGGKNMNMGTMDFRCKVIPKPTAMVGTYTGGRIPKESLLTQGGLRVSMEGFDFPVRYTVTSFTMAFNTGGDAQAPIQATGSQFTAEMKAKLAKLRRGNKVYIENIRAKGPDGEKAVGNPQMIFTIQ